MTSIVANVSLRCLASLAMTGVNCEAMRYSWSAQDGKGKMDKHGNAGKKWESQETGTWGLGLDNKGIE